MKRCSSCSCSGDFDVCGFPVCGACFTAWAEDCPAPAEHFAATAVSHEALCAAWKASTRDFLRTRRGAQAEAERPARGNLGGLAGTSGGGQ